MKVKNLFLIAAGVFMLTTTFTATAKKLPKEVKMTKEVLMDKIKGGWAGKTIGCSYGGPTEFKYSGFMNDDNGHIRRIRIALRGRGCAP